MNINELEEKKAQLTRIYHVNSPYVFLLIGLMLGLLFNLAAAILDRWITQGFKAESLIYELYVVGATVLFIAALSVFVWGKFFRPSSKLQKEIDVLLKSEATD